MKKLKVILCLLLLVLILTGCKDKKALDKEEFSKKMAEKSYQVSDYLEKMDPQAKTKIKSASLAIAKDKTHQFEFYELNDKDIATHMYNTNKNLFEKEKGPESASVGSSGENHANYRLKAKGKILYVSRIDNTVFYANIDEKYEDQLDEIIKLLNY